MVDGLDAAVTELHTALVTLTAEGERTRADLAALQTRVATLHANLSTCTPGWARELELELQTKLHQPEQAMHWEHRELDKELAAINTQWEDLRDQVVQLLTPTAPEPAPLPPDLVACLTQVEHILQTKVICLHSELETTHATVVTLR